MPPRRSKPKKTPPYHMGFEGLVGSLVHNPRVIHWWEKRMRNGYFRRRSKGIASIVGKLFGFRFSEFKWHFIGMSHLDAAWLWPVMDTKIRALKTFAQAIENIQRFPFFTMSLTSPQYFQWVKDYAPDLWQQVKEEVAKGRIELTGGCWIEPDLDMPWGECLVRQRLHGQLFYLREFGKLATVESLSDVFGFAYSVPQILLKSGAKAFWTTKCFWNDENPWPFSAFAWQGVDGSRIFTYQFHFNWFDLPKLKDYRKAGRLPTPGKAQTVLSAQNTNAEIEACLSNDRLRDLGFFYGWGDGGKGPDRVEVGATQLLAQLGYGKHTSTEKFFKLIEAKVGNRYLIWNDEMYLEYHRGTKTSVMEVKHYNRQAERWAQAAETLLSIINANQPHLIPFDKPALFEMWRKILFNQFHDILPGSSIPDVYLLAIQELQDAIHYAQTTIQRCLASVPHSEKDFVVYNPLAWVRSEYCVVNGTLHYIENVPGLSTQIVSLAKTEAMPSAWPPVHLEEDAYVLENDTMRVKVSKTSGTLTSLVLKATGKELLAPSPRHDQLGCGLRIFYSFPTNYKAWNIGRDYPQHRVPVTIAQLPTITTTPEEVPCIRSTFAYLHSRATVSIFLCPRDPLLHLTITTDNQDPQLLVKFFFPLALASEWVTSEIPYASIARRRVKVSEREKAKWEMNMQKWVDISDPEGGIAVLNNSRYGFNATARGLYITLARTAKHPRPIFHSAHLLLPSKKRPVYMDMKPFTFELGVMPHPGSWRESGVVQAAYNFNSPLIIADSKDGGAANGPIKPECLSAPFVEVGAPNVILTTIKPSEWCGSRGESLLADAAWQWNRSLVLRLVEQHGRAVQVPLRFSPYLAITRVEEVNLLEMQPSAPFPLQQNQILVPFKPYEIKTLRLWLHAKV